MKIVLFALILMVSVAQAAQPEATYLVPASKDGKIPAATYDLNDFSISGPVGSRVVSFSLPVDLLGPNVAPIQMNEIPSPDPLNLNFKSEEVSANCSTLSDPVSVNCAMSFTLSYSTVDQASVDAFLKTKYGNTPEVLSEKMVTSAHFRNDPEGVLSFSLSTQ